MRKKNFSKKLLSMALAGSLVVGMTSTLSGCGNKKNGTVTLDVYSRPFETEVQCQVKLCTV